MTTHREFIFVQVPHGMPDAGCFRLLEAPIPRPVDGQVLARTHYLSIDPYMRRQMAGGHGQYANPLKPGDVMIGRGVGVVIESRHPDFRVGDPVQSEFGWREHAVLSGQGLRKLPADLQPLSLGLGIVGQSGATAMVGLVDIAGIKPGETVVVSAAAGAVGSAVGQIARIKGCRAIGIAGGPRSAATSSTTSASRTASTTRRARSGRHSPGLRPRASTSTSTTSAETSSMPCCRTST